MTGLVWLNHGLAYHIRKRKIDEMQYKSTGCNHYG